MLLHPPSKLNRFLHIVGRRADGYHLLQTAFELIDWCDELRIEVRDDGLIELLGDSLGWAPDLDLTVRAARLLQPLARPGSGCTMSLRKRVPTGAGLGGGSADAAAVLLGLNQLWQLQLDRAELMRLGLRLGADVPVFVAQQPAFAQGVGEILTPLPFVPRHYAVIYPGVALATAPMFAAPALRRDCPLISVDEYLAGCPTVNVFAPLALAHSREIAAAADHLSRRLGPALLTGSGSAVYAQAQSRAAAELALQDLPAHWLARAVSSTTNWFDNGIAAG